MIPATARHHFTITELDHMVEADVFAEDARLELIAGEVVEMSPIGRRHAACVRRLTNVLARLVGDSALIDAQNPVVLDDYSQPQPDLVLLREAEDFYADRHPGPGDVLLLIEVADTSLAYDRQVKLPAYAGAGIPEVWIVDLGGRAVEVYREPRSGEYGSSERLEDPQATLSPQALPGIVLTVASLLG